MLWMSEMTATRKPMRIGGPGAGAFQTFRRITLPAIKWGVVYGVVLSLARSLGEFGAVKEDLCAVIDPEQHDEECSSRFIGGDD